MINDTITNLTWLNLFILTIGAYSVTRFIITDSLLEGLRQRFFHQFPHDGFASNKKPARGEIRRTSNNIYVVDTGTKLGDLLSCPWCFGFWASLAVYVSFVFVPDWTIFLIVPLTMRALVGGFANKIGGG